MEINGQSYSVNNTKQELYIALRSAMFNNDVDNNNVSGINQEELNNFEQLVEKYLNSDNENDVEIAQSYKNFIEDLKAADEEYKCSQDYINDMKENEDELNELKQCVSPENKVLSFIKKSFINFVDNYTLSENKKKDRKEKSKIEEDNKTKSLEMMREYYNTELKKSELKKQNVISDKVCYDNINNDLLSSNGHISIGGKMYFKD